MKTSAWVRSQSLEIPRDPLVARLDVDKGVKSARGGNGTPDVLHASVDVPGIQPVDRQHCADARRQRALRAEQVLVAEASDGVRSADLAARAKAWVLPKRKPGVDQSDDDPPYAWNVADISDAVLKQSKPLPLDAVPTENGYATLQSFKYHATPGDRIVVRVAGDLKSAGGYLLAEPVTTAFTVPDYPKLLRFMADGSLLSMSGSKRLSVVSRNLPGMKVEIGRVLPDQLQHLVSFNNGTYARPELSYSFSEDHIVERFVQTRAFPAGDPGKAHYEGIDLGQYLKGGKRGVFLLHLTKYDPAAEKKKADDAKDGDASSGDGSQDQSDNADSGDSSGNGDDSDGALGDTRLIVVTDLGCWSRRHWTAAGRIHPVDPHGQAGCGRNRIGACGERPGAVRADHERRRHRAFPAFRADAEKRPQLYVVKRTPTCRSCRWPAAIASSISRASTSTASAMRRARGNCPRTCSRIAGCIAPAIRSTSA